MSSYLIIDGYNLIHQIPKLLRASQKSIEFARDTLYGMVAAYCDHYEVNGIIVYDGNRAKSTVEEGNPMTIFSKRAESADTVIESIVYKHDDKSNIRVVTDDRVMSNVVIGMGALTMQSGLFEDETAYALKSIRGKIGHV